MVVFWDMVANIYIVEALKGPEDQTVVITCRVVGT